VIENKCGQSTRELVAIDYAKRMLADTWVANAVAQVVRAKVKARRW
jgi:flavoprotein